MRLISVERELITFTEPETEQIQTGEGVRFELTEKGYQAVRLTKEEIVDGQERCLNNYTDLINRLNPHLRIDVISISRDREIQDNPVFIVNKSRDVLAP